MFVKDHCKHVARHVFERFRNEIRLFPNDRSSIKQSQVRTLYFLTLNKLSPQVVIFLCRLLIGRISF
jgi:hypothetical protein